MIHPPLLSEGQQVMNDWKAKMDTLINQCYKDYIDFIFKPNETGATIFEDGRSKEHMSLTKIKEKQKLINKKFEDERREYDKFWDSSILIRKT